MVAAMEMAGAVIMEQASATVADMEMVSVTAVVVIMEQASAMVAVADMATAVAQ